MFRRIGVSHKSDDGVPKGAENAAPRIEFTRFRLKPAANAPAQSEFVTKLAELGADLKQETKSTPRIELPKRL